MARARRRALRPPRTSWFTRFARWTSHATGRPAALVIVAWATTGPLFDSEAVHLKLDELIRARSWPIPRGSSSGSAARTPARRR